MRSLLAGADTCAVMPTGGGKSLCYQLPAALSNDGTVIVVSPLIALMQDQVAQLAQMGIPAARLNSALSRAEQAEVSNAALRGDFRLLYLSPERLAMPDTIASTRSATSSLPFEKATPRSDSTTSADRHAGEARTSPIATTRSASDRTTEQLARREGAPRKPGPRRPSPRIVAGLDQCVDHHRQPLRVTAFARVRIRAASVARATTSAASQAGAATYLSRSLSSRRATTNRPIAPRIAS